MGSRDFYETLGVAPDADAGEIHRAYRDLARRYHPDIDGEDGAAERFKEISEAYAVLSDPEERAEYDALGRDVRAGPTRAAAPQPIRHRGGAPSGLQVDVGVAIRGPLASLLREAGRHVRATSARRKRRAE
jgi:curved DNA-binding protein